MPKLASVSLIILGLVAVAAPASVLAKAAPDMKVLDPDSDGTVSLAEAEKAADAKFAALDPDHDGTIDAKEAKGLMDHAAFTASDPDKDGTIDKKEYAAAVEAAFKSADPDGDGTLNAKELAAPMGQKLLEMIQ